MGNILKYFSVGSFNRKYSSNTSTLVLTLYAILVFVRVVQSTSFSTFYVGINIFLNYLTYVLMFFIAILYLFCFGKNKRQLIIGMAFSLIIILTGLKSSFNNDFNIMLALGFCLFGCRLNVQRLALAQSIAMLFALSFVSFFSILGFLPTKGSSSIMLSFQSSYQEIVYFLGFNHPNAYGAVLTMMFIGFLFGIGVKRLKLFFFLFIILIIIDFRIGANTAALGAIFFLFGLVTMPLRKQFNNFMKILTRFLIVGLPSFAFWLGYHPNTPVANFVNQYVPSRPSIWAYYLNMKKLSLFQTPPDLNFSVGGKYIFGNGNLDGGYIYITVYRGLLPLMAILISIWLLNEVKIEDEKVSWMRKFLVLSILLMAFPESHMVFFYENVFILSIGMLQVKKSDREFLFMQKEKRT